MVNKNSPIFIACRPSGIIAILLWFCIALFLSSNASAANLMLNGDFETGDFTNWNYAAYIVSSADARSGTYSAYYDVYVDGGGGSGNSEDNTYFYQSIDLTEVDLITFYYKHDVTFVGGGGLISYVYCDIDRDNSYEWIVSSEALSYTYAEVDTSEITGVHNVEFGSYFGFNQAEFYIDCRFDDIIADEAELEINSIVFNPNVSISNQSQQYFDYNVNDTWDGYYYFVRSIWEPETYNLYLNENWLNIDMSGENVKLLYEFVCYQSNYSLELYATTYPTFDIGYAHLIAESPIILYDSDYIPPEEPEEPEEPEIPDPEPEPDPEPNPPIPPTQPNGTGANQSINVTWTGEYYNVVNNTFGGLCSPIYNFTNWSLSPIYSLNNSIGEFNYYMNESFTQTAQDSSILYESINTIYGAIHPKIRNVITYYLIWVVLLIVLKKD